jgi:hypothetical protein
MGPNQKLVVEEEFFAERSGKMGQLILGVYIGVITAAPLLHCLLNYKRVFNPFGVFVNAACTRGLGLSRALLPSLLLSES